MNNTNKPDEEQYLYLSPVDWQPDLSWDYAALWETVHGTIKPELDRLIEEMAKVENATPETDKAIMVRLQWLHTFTSAAIGSLKARELKISQFKPEQDSLN